MALIRTITEAKAALPRVLSNLSSNSLLPDFGAAEVKYLVPLIGLSQYDNIEGKINADPIEDLTGAEEALLSYLRRMSCIYAYLDDLGTDNAKITDSGIRSTESANMPRVFGWQFNELRNTLLQKAFDATELLLKFLFENKTDYPSWTSSDEYAVINSLIIKTGSDFDAHYKLWQPMRTFYSIKALLDEVQEDLLKPAIGEDLVAYFVEAENLTDDEKKILKLLKKATAYYTIKKACEHYSVRFDAQGFTIMSAGGDSENKDTAGRSDTTNAFHGGLFDLKMQACDKDGQTYLAKAKKAMVAFREISGSVVFNDAFDEGPLVDYEDPADRTRGNENRKGFRF
jgi:hypothetical protein